MKELYFSVSGEVRYHHVGWMNGWMDGRKEGWMEGRVDGRKGGWMEWWMEGDSNMGGENRGKDADISVSIHPSTCTPNIQIHALGKVGYCFKKLLKM